MIISRRYFPRPEEYAAIAGSTILFAIAFPPFPLIVPAFLCLVPFAVAVVRRADGAGSWRQAARLGFWFGMLGYAANLYWIAIALSIYTKSGSQYPGGAVELSGGSFGRRIVS